MLTGKKERLRRAKDAALAALSGPAMLPAERRDELTVRVGIIRDFHLLHQEGVDTLILPVSRANLHQLRPLPESCAVVRRRSSGTSPSLFSKRTCPSTVRRSTSSSSMASAASRPRNLSHFALLQGRDGGHLHRLPAVFPQQPGAPPLAGAGRNRRNPLHGRRLPPTWRVCSGRTCR